MGSAFVVHFLIDMKLIKLRREMRFLDLRINSCTILKKTTSNWIMKKFLNEFMRTSNLPTSCPLKANFVYKVNNFTVNDDWIPQMAPLCDFIITIEYYNRNERFAVWKLYGGIVQK
ncbi:uncharacterized protein LOC142219442 [Haematobia irritans]|uniref:uncharacterized protein LOC142219442 n=1 Tax=Haematobia irritans TaxID=7368 RepID=UPI003F4FEEBC